MDLTPKLDLLAHLYDLAHQLMAEQKEVVDSILTPEIKEQLAAVDAEFSSRQTTISERISQLEGEIETQVIAQGVTSKGTRLQAVYNKGRVSWDNKALDGYAVAHPELLNLRKVGLPSVSFRKV